MTTRLIEEAFEKAAAQSGKESLNGRAEFLSEVILEQFKYSVSAKSLIRYYKQETVPNHQLKNYLAAYLAYGSYEEYVLAHPKEVITSANKYINRRKSPKVLLLILLFLPLVGISAYVGYRSGEKECMVWQGDHYEKTSCTGAALEKEFVPHLYKNMKKITVTDTISFFNNAEPRVWYDKSNNHLEFFTAPGLHPENGKTLKPITKYIIEKYIRK